MQTTSLLQDEPVQTEHLSKKRGFFGNTRVETFEESGWDCDVNLSNREKSLLTMDKRTYFSRSILSLWMF